MTPDGSQQEKVTNQTDYSEYMPDVSVRNEVVFTRETGVGLWGLCKVDLDDPSRALTRLTTGQYDTDRSWSPDGREAWAEPAVCRADLCSHWPSRA